MENRYEKHAMISEEKFREILRAYALDIIVLITSKLYRVNYHTVHRLDRLLRDRVVELVLVDLKPFVGEIEVDESYYGARRIRGKGGCGASGKAPVLGLHKRGDRVFVSVVASCFKRELMPILKGHILGQSDVYTDGWKAYGGLVTNGFKHHRIHHHENEFARGKNHINGIESFWSYAKFRMIKLRGVRIDKFFLHLKECEWRWNQRRLDIYKLLLSNLRRQPLSAT